MSKYLKINDHVSLKDGVGFGHIHNGLWAKTEVIGGYNDVIINPYGKSTINDPIFTEKNIVPIGGVSYAFEHIFGVSESQIHVPTLKESANIGPDDSQPIVSETYQTPEGTAVTTYRYGHFVQLFGVGITGTGENDASLYHPDYRESSITLSKVNSDGLIVTGTMLPFRYTTATLDSSERKQYFGKKKDSNGVTGYYLKKFESDPVIKHIWKTGEDVDNEELISNNDIWTNMSGLNAVESFIEIYLKISKKDIKEWFVALEQADRTRINTIALFNGQFVDGDNAADYGDYRDVRLFSKVCINPEYLDLNKDLNILYRIYGA